MANSNKATATRDRRDGRGGVGRLLASAMAPSFRLMQALQAVSGLAFVYALAFHRNDLAWWGLALAAYFVTGCLGLTVTMHRVLTHRAIKLARPVEVLFTLAGAFGGTGSSIAWTAMHRAHHAHVDTDRDPHSPTKLGWALIASVYDYNFDVRHAKDLLRDPFHLFLHRYYALVLLVWALGLAAVDVRLCLFGFLVPVFAQITISNLTSLLTHSQGYRSFATKDESANNPIIAVLAWGEGWHNNHHAAPTRWSFQRRWWEIDPGALVIRALMAAGLASREPGRDKPAPEARAARPQDAAATPQDALA